MTRLNRSDWYDIARRTTWTPTYVSEEALFPPEMSDPYGLSLDAWSAYDEPYKISYREYVQVQREKDAGAYSVKAALSRQNFVASAHPAWRSLLKQHYGALALAEALAIMGEGRMARFGKAPGMRNMATFGMMDETRHTQIQLLFPHEHVEKDRQFAWASKALHTNEWAAVAARHAFDDMTVTRDAVNTAIFLTFAFETGFTNMQFLGLAEDAAKAGDTSFANLISSVQTDESRHAQIGAPLLKILLENGRKSDAQRIIDIAFWRSWKLFTVLTGPIMDYYPPLTQRHTSFKEFMLEWIVGQFERTMLDMGLDLPWYWDIFLRDLDETHHGMHMGVWFWRPTVWWHPNAGVSADERDWLEEKYPGWNDSWGRAWDVITRNLKAGREHLTYPECLPMLCAMSNIPIPMKPGRNGHNRYCTLDFEGKRYYFASEPDRWCFLQEPNRYKGHKTIVDRFVEGLIQPPTLEGALKYMGLDPEDQGQDSLGYAWATERPIAAE